MEKEQKREDLPKVLIVDDISINVQILENIIASAGYEPYGATSVKEALDIMDKTMPQIILSDLSMPDINGLEFCRLLKRNPQTRDIPFIFITVADSRDEKKEAFSAGAVDFIPKPFEPVEVIMRINNHLNIYYIKKEMEDYNRMMHKMMNEQKKQIEKERENVLLALANLAEKRNLHIHVGDHLEKVGHNSRILAQSLQLIPEYENIITDEFVETIETASKLHDIGKIVLPNEEVIQESCASDNSAVTGRHYTEEGARILEEISGGSSSSRFLNMAILIARYHRANWDGTGYPENVSAEDIPLAARIMAVADDFDTFMGGDSGSRSVEERVRMINDRSGSVYDPKIVNVFNRIIKQLRTD